MSSCVVICRSDATRINSFGTAETNQSKCVSHNLCVETCLLGLVRIATPEHPVYTACMNQDRGVQTGKGCSVGCTAYGICVKNYPADAVRIENNHVVVDKAKYIVCSMCTVKCSRGVILNADGIFTVKAQRQEA